MGLKADISSLSVNEVQELRKAWGKYEKMSRVKGMPQASVETNSKLLIYGVTLLKKIEDLQAF